MVSTPGNVHDSRPYLALWTVDARFKLTSLTVMQQSRNQTKVVVRHGWEAAKARIDAHCLTPEGKQLMAILVCCERMTG